MKKTLEQGTGVTVLAIVRVSVASGKIRSTEKDIIASTFLQNAGFIKVSCPYHRVGAEAGAFTTFFLEYDPANPANRKPCRLVSCTGETFREIDLGLTEFAPGKNSKEIDFTGERMKSWEVHVATCSAKALTTYDLARKRNQIQPPKPWQFPSEIRVTSALISYEAVKAQTKKAP